MHEILTKQFPTTTKELKLFDFEQPDVIIISGDAFIDHPAFGAAVIARVLKNIGLNVAIVPQPNWKDDLRDFKKFGEPKLFFAVTSGNMDSMVNHYTANKRLRNDDAYTPGGKSGFRPDYAATLYSNIIKKLYPESIVVLGGIEASLRRFTHYDYWKNTLLPSILVSSKADIVCYGMAEKAIAEVAIKILEYQNVYAAQQVNQTAFLSDINDTQKDDVVLHSHQDCINSKNKFAENFVVIEKTSNQKDFKYRITQIHNNNKIIVNPPYPPISEAEMDEIYSLPFTRKAHPKYDKKGDIPAFEMIKNSVTSHRGCFGGCSFCTISAHQGRFISGRSPKSIADEIKTITKDKDFKGHITDLGGPSANMYKMEPKNLKICQSCNKNSCIYPEVCKNIDTSHQKLLELYRMLRKIEGVNKISIGSGIRYDLILKDKENDSSKMQYLTELIKHHVSGRLKVAPEHTSKKVLKEMRKPDFGKFIEFKKLFTKITQKHGLNQHIVPYFISAHPGCTEKDMMQLSQLTNELGFNLEQVQGFTPTPMTLSSVVFYTGINPYTKEKVYSAKTVKERKKQLSYFFQKSKK